LTVYEKEYTGKVRKYYCITKQGKGLLDKKMEEWKQYSTAITNVLVLEGY
jgi:DNA-binding PadR family transcriptional regulator